MVQQEARSGSRGVGTEPSTSGLRHQEQVDTARCLRSLPDLEIADGHAIGLDDERLDLGSPAARVRARYFVPTEGTTLPPSVHLRIAEPADKLVEIVVRGRPQR